MLHVISKDDSDGKEKKRKRTLRVEGGASGDGKVELKKIKKDPTNMTKPHVFYAEEEEVEKRDVKEDVDLFVSACGDITSTIKEIQELKDSKAKNSKEKVDSKRVEGSLQMIMLKKLNRLAHIRCKKVRDETNEHKQRIDVHHLQLQNLLYEVMHLEKEITKCLEFKSKDEEIDLIPVDKFYEEAPADIAKPEVTKQDLHQRTLARLDWELAQRQKLAEELKEAQSKRETIETDIKKKQDYLDTLQPKLNNILQSTKPVQEYLKMPFDDVREEHQTAQYLPPPLYVLYMQTSAYKDACDKRLTVSLDGDVNAAKSVDLSTAVALEEESDSDPEEQEEREKKTSKRRRKTVDVKTAERKSKILKKHPLFVVLHVMCKDGSSLQLTFHYLMYLSIITVNVKVRIGSDTSTSCVSGGDLLSPDLILNELYPGDSGDNSPNSGNQYELSRFGLKDFSYYIEQLGRPYTWAQWMGGLQFLAEEGQKGPGRGPQSAVSSRNMQLTMKKIRQRIKSRLSLLKQLNALERKSIPLLGEYQHLFPAKLSAQLVSWQRSTYEDFLACPYTKAVVDAGLAHDSDLYFTAGIERRSAKMTARIVVAPDYPAVAPNFSINIKWQTDRNATNDNDIQEMEQEVNIHYDELINEKSRDPLLANQLQRLVMCFDVYLELESMNMANEGPVEIAKEKVFTRVARGPQRSKPYKFSSDIGIFTHR